MLLICFFLLFFSSLQVNSAYFIAREGNKVLEREGNCDIRYPPGSTFKIAISLMGYNEGILLTSTQPEYAFKKGYPNFRPNWDKPQNPTTWIKNSCVWYSQLITQKIGMAKFTSYLKQFKYGNQNVTGDPGQNNGLTHAWLSSSLKISPAEQTLFLEKLVDGTLPVSEKSTKMAQSLFFIETLPTGWKLYGKTGGVYLKRGAPTPRQMAWFVGWLTHGHRTIVFAAGHEAGPTRFIVLRKKNIRETRSKLIELTQKL